MMVTTVTTTITTPVLIVTVAFHMYMYVVFLLHVAGALSTGNGSAAGIM